MTKDKIQMILKGSLTLCVLLALFFSYQLPAGDIQQTVRVVFLSIAMLLLLVLIKYSNKVNWQNILLFAMLGITMLFYIIE